MGIRGGRNSPSYFVVAHAALLFFFEWHSPVSVHASSRRCARISYRLEDDYLFATGQHFQNPYLSTTTAEQSCEGYCRGGIREYAKAQLDDGIRDGTFENTSIAKVWEEYTANPDPCLADSSVCISPQSIQSTDTYCKCGYLFGIMRIYKEGVEHGADNCEAPCSIEDVQKRFEARFPRETYHLAVSNWMSIDDIACDRRDECDCLTADQAYCIYGRG